jgi:putative phosphoribosyl transferase
MRDRAPVLHSRREAGRMLAEMLAGEEVRADVICPIPSGGIPVGVEMAVFLKSKLCIAVVRKVQIPGNPEAGFGAVAWDGSVLMHQRLEKRLGLRVSEREAAVARAREHVKRRLAQFTGERPFPRLDGLHAVLTDDGLASGCTMLAAVRAIRSAGPSRVTVAVPTGSAATVARVSREVDELACLNVRSGFSFAVADAYEEWYDVADDEVLELLAQARASSVEIL